MKNQQNQNKAKTKIVANFQLGKAIGKGTFATVREAVHIPTNQKVAIKILHKKMIVDNRDKLNLSREIRIIKKLRHPNIAQLFQIIETNSKIYFVLERVTEGQLYELIVKSKESRLPEQTASKYFQQLLNAVQYLHSLGITHRDLKPQNILIDHHQAIKLIDFGLSNLYQDDEKLTTACGSPCYAAPQMLSQKSYSPFKVDIWSCGIVLYTMLCGYLPFQHQNTAKLYQFIQKGIYDEPDHLSANAKDMLRKMLQVDPEKRLNIKQIRKHPFCRYFQQPVIRGLLPSEKIYIRSDIIQQMKSLGYNGFIKDIQENAVNQNTTTFYLLLFKKLKEQQISPLTYYEKIVEIKSEFKSKSFSIRKVPNPQQFPTIDKKHIASMINIDKLKRQSILVRVITSKQNLSNISRPINLRIKKIIK